MALPTPTDLKKMDYAHKASPFIDVPSSNSIGFLMAGMDYAYKAQPFVSNTIPGQKIQVKANIIGLVTRTISPKGNIRNTTSFPRSITAKGKHYDFVERFIDTTYKDVGNTTSYWDTTLPGIVRSPKQGESLP